MSDFVFSASQLPKGILTSELQSIYLEDSPEVDEFHGKWGSLGISRNLYNGFHPYENDSYICAVVGGPVLCFRDNLFLNGGQASDGTVSIFQRWLSGQMKWDEDLSGPFVVVIVEKKKAVAHCITDLMSFIPVFAYQHSSEIMISTHIDVLGAVSKQKHDIDIVSKVDFVLHGIVTYPYTVYRQITQLQPASIHSKVPNSNKMSSEFYWLPTESINYEAMDDAARELREALEDYVSRVTEGMTSVAQFISGGEDSRTLSGLLPKKLNRDAFIFLDSMNLEGRRAKKAADAYDAQFKLAIRSKFFYLEILPSSAELVGSGAEYIHAHTLKFYKSCRLMEYPAVFGGLYSDDLLKGECIVKMLEKLRLPFIPQIKSRAYSRSDKIRCSLFKAEVLEELNRRRSAHLKWLKSFRKESAEEWFELWPSSMNWVLPSTHVNRRLFRSYEPFMSNGVVKVSASVPQNWRLNRRLFLKTTKPYLEQSKWLFHSDGRLPYFPWYLNCIIQSGVWSYQQISTRIGLVKGFQGPWGEWKMIIKSQEFQDYISKYAKGITVMADAFTEERVEKLFKSNELTRMQHINLLQTLYSNLKNINIKEELIEVKNTPATNFLPEKKSKYSN
ncbi:hypothetical protein SAMN04487975_11513 [Planococcus glaciei]|uniref:hypothetical protein n=1 Tax=Planococcus glaciei TaxID=459472 RepID=UPI000885B2E0|nr:hypothetical protein [Planococcus glaciei]SDI33955.1 hypothetical protein SAMN04487975_11513 [Planococcus glaciei]